MLFRASRHFYTILTNRTIPQSQCVNALPSSTSFLQINDAEFVAIVFCVNALPSSTSFLLRQRLKPRRKSPPCVNALPSSTSFLRNITSFRSHQETVSMLFRAPLHFYSIIINCSILRRPCINALPSPTSFLPPTCQKPLIYKAF